jgi:hypothetical protein
MDQSWGLEVYGSFNTKTYFLVVSGSLCGLLWQHHREVGYDGYVKLHG